VAIIITQKYEKGDNSTSLKKILDLKENLSRLVKSKAIFTIDVLGCECQTPFYFCVSHLRYLSNAIK